MALQRNRENKSTLCLLKGEINVDTRLMIIIKLEFVSNALTKASDSF